MLGRPGLELVLALSGRGRLAFDALADGGGIDGGGDADAELSADGATLVFTSNRPGGAGGWDLYEVTRVCL